MTDQVRVVGYGPLRPALEIAPMEVGYCHYTIIINIQVLFTFVIVIFKAKISCFR